MEIGSIKYQKKVDEAFRGLNEMHKYRGMDKQSHIEYNQDDGSSGFKPASPKRI